MLAVVTWCPIRLRTALIGDKARPAPLIVPVILLGIGIYGVQGRIGLLGSDLGLVLAHVVLCLPLTFLVLANALAFIDVSLEQAAWTMGAGRARAFWTIVCTMPLP